MERDIKKLIKSLDALTKENKKLVSPFGNFARGIFFGLGSVVGASVVAAIILGIVANFFKSIKGMLNF